MPSSTRRVVQFTGPHQVEVVDEPLSAPATDEVLVRTTLSAISPGTERLIYTNQVPHDALVDSSIEAFTGEFGFPLTYGYAAVGRVEAVGDDVDDDWNGARVFSFRPHVSHFAASPENLIRLPDEVRDVDAVLIPNVETAVNFLMDGRPLIGEQVAIFGQGVVGLLTTALAARHPLDSLYTIDPSADRRARSESWGADRSFDAGEMDALRSALGITSSEPNEPGDHMEGADLTYEVTGQPAVLNDAIASTGYDGRIVVGSWYGRKEAPIDLGGRFHRSRMELISSQVSTIAPEHRGRWTKGRRMRTVLRMLTTIRPGEMVTDRYALADAPVAYESLAEEDDDFFQPVFQYE
jgi:2-desacetyl-2-hydroxyethyl bacteriochlorophyllide A dehydrogenase